MTRTANFILFFNIFRNSLSAAIAAYNAGFKRMSKNYNEIDNHTTGQDYSNDVVARAQYFERNGL